MCYKYHDTLKGTQHTNERNFCMRLFCRFFLIINSASLEFALETAVGSNPIPVLVQLQCNCEIREQIFSITVIHCRMESMAASVLESWTWLASYLFYSSAIFPWSFIFPVFSHLCYIICFVTYSVVSVFFFHMGPIILDALQVFFTWIWNVWIELYSTHEHITSVTCTVCLCYMLLGLGFWISIGIANLQITNWN